LTHYLVDMDFFKRKPKATVAEVVPSCPKPLRWILPHRLAVGPIPNEAIEAQLAQSGIQAILTLCAETEGTLPTNIADRFQWRRCVLPDSHYQEAMEPDQLRQVVSHLHDTIAQGHPTYVHCLAGMERSPTVCVTYLCLYEKMPLWEALNWVKQCNPRTSITSEQLQVIQKATQSLS
jgi:protein-tyrosine phosphatase